MLKRKSIVVGVGLGLFMPVIAWAQSSSPGDGPRPGAAPISPVVRIGLPAGGIDAVKAQIQASDEEWKVISPLLRKLVAARGLALAGMDGSAGNSGTPGGFGGGGGGFGPGGNDTFGGPAGAGGFGPGTFVSGQMFTQADKNGDGKVSSAEFAALADVWFDQLDPKKSGKVSQAQFVERFSEILPPPQGFGPGGGGGGGGRDGGGGGGGRGGRGPGQFMGPSFFTAVDANKDGSLTRDELTSTFKKWFGEWDSAKKGSIDEDQLRDGMNSVLPQQQFGGRGGPRGGGGPGDGGAGGNGGPGGGPGGARGGPNAGGPSGNANASSANSSSPQPPQGGPRGAGGGGENNAVSQMMADFRTALADPKRTPETVRDKAAAIRNARNRGKADWQAAQKEILLLLTDDQKDVLTGLGYLE